MVTAQLLVSELAARAEMRQIARRTWSAETNCEELVSRADWPPLRRVPTAAPLPAAGNEWIPPLVAVVTKARLRYS